MTLTSFCMEILGVRKSIFICFSGVFRTIFVGRIRYKYARTRPLSSFPTIFFISTCDANNKFIIFSDSLSVLKAMNHTSSKNPQIQKLLEKCHELSTYKEIVLCWIPSHIGIQGNEMVDKQAKTSLSLEPTSFKIPFSNFKPSINKYILEEWQTSWNNSMVINFLTPNQLLVNINQLFETLEEKK